MRLSVYPDFGEAYAATLNELLNTGESVPTVRDEASVGSEFGHAARPTLELRPYGFRVADPSACLLVGSARQPNLIYAVAQFLWVMRGSDDLEEIAFYNARGRAFSDDGVRLNAAFGARIRRPDDQLQAAIDLLLRDPATRRALVVIARAGDLIEPTRDYSCAQSLHLFVRAGHLEAMTTMRSQSAMMVLPYDAALFMTIQWWAAAVLGIPCGAHTWLASSLHMYEDEISLATEILADPPQSFRLPPTTQPERSIRHLQNVEADIRLAVLGKQHPHLHGLDVAPLDAMHRAFARVLVANAALSLGCVEVARDASDLLPTEWRQALERSLASPERVPW